MGLNSNYPMKPTTVKESKKTASWFLAIPHDDEEAFEALNLLRGKGYFNTRLYRLKKYQNQKLITRFYLSYPQRQLVHLPTLTEEQLEGRIYDKALCKIRELERENAKLQEENARLKEEYIQIEEGYMNDEGLYDNDDVENILKSAKWGTWTKSVNADNEYPELHTPNINFVAPDMSQTQGLGTHVLIDVNSIPPELETFLAGMMDQLNSNTLRISKLEQC